MIRSRAQCFVAGDRIDDARLPIDSAYQHRVLILRAAWTISARNNERAVFGEKEIAIWRNLQPFDKINFRRRGRSAVALGSINRRPISAGNSQDRVWLDDDRCRPGRIDCYRMIE